MGLKNCRKYIGSLVHFQHVRPAAVMAKLKKWHQAQIKDWQSIMGIGPGLSFVIGIAVMSLLYLIDRFLFKSFLDTISVEAVIAVVTVALAVLVPLAILMLGERSFILDKQTCLEVVLRMPLILVLFMGTIIPNFLLWGYFSGQPLWRSALLTALAATIFYLIKIIVSIYAWLVGLEKAGSDSYRNKKRLEYLTTIPDNEKASAWLMVWREGSGRDLIGDDKLIPIFLEYLESFAGGADEDRGEALLRQFIVHFDDIALYITSVQEDLVHFVIRVMGTPTGNNQKPPYYATFSGVPADLLDVIVKRSFYFKENSAGHNLFLVLGNYRWKKGVKKGQFIKKFVSSALKDVSSAARLKDYSAGAWDVFPKEWKITSKNLQDKSETKPFAQEWLEQYKRLVQRRYSEYDHKVSQGEKQYIDYLVIDITVCLLPDIDYDMWFILLTLHCMPLPSIRGLDKEEQIKSLAREFVQSKSDFINIYKARSVWENLAPVDGGYVSAVRKEILEINKLTKFFPLVAEKELLGELINAFRSLERYQSESKEEKKRREMLDVLRFIQDYMDA